MTNIYLDTLLQDRLEEGEFRLSDGSYVCIGGQIVELWNDGPCQTARTAEDQPRLHLGEVHATTMGSSPKSGYYKLMVGAYDNTNSGDVRIAKIVVR